MTRIISRALIFLMTLLFITPTLAEGNKMEISPLWQLTTALKTTWGKTIDDVARVINHPLVEMHPPAADRYTAAPFRLANGLQIKDLDIRLDTKKGGEVVHIALVVEGACISLNDVKSYFSPLMLSNTPRGNIPDAVTSYRTPEDARGVAYAFSFAVRNPDCLKRIIIRNYH